MRILLLSSLLFITTIGCASKKIQKEVNREMTLVPAVRSDSELHSLESKLLMESENISPKQKSQLSSLLLKMKNQNMAIDNEIMKTKAVLFQTLIDEDNSKMKLNVLENQLLKLNRKKTRYSLSAYREAKSIVGKSDVPLEKTLRMIDNRAIHEF